MQYRTPTYIYNKLESWPSGLDFLFEIECFYPTFNMTTLEFLVSSKSQPGFLVVLSSINRCFVLYWCRARTHVQHQYGVYDNFIEDTTTTLRGTSPVITYLVQSETHTNRYE